MPQWSNSTRRDRLPPDWQKIRRRILKRDGFQCQSVKADGSLCLEVANEVDHKEAGDDHSDANLEAICTWHHRKKSSREGAAAANRQRRANRSKFRRTEEHPGLL